MELQTPPVRSRALARFKPRRLGRERERERERESERERDRACSYGYARGRYTYANGRAAKERARITFRAGNGTVKVTVKSLLDLGGGRKNHQREKLAPTIIVIA